VSWELEKEARGSSQGGREVGLTRLLKIKTAQTSMEKPVESFF